MILELRIDILDNSNIIWSFYCEPAPLFTLQAQVTTPGIYAHPYSLAFTVGFQTFSQGPTYIPDYEILRENSSLECCFADINLLVRQTIIVF